LAGPEGAGGTKAWQEAAFALAGGGGARAGRGTGVRLSDPREVGPLSLASQRPRAVRSRRAHRP
jgi:hypothetical protein